MEDKRNCLTRASKTIRVPKPEKLIIPQTEDNPTERLSKLMEKEKQFK